MTEREQLRQKITAAAGALKDAVDELVALDAADDDLDDDDDTCAGYAPPEVRSAFARAVAEKLDREIMDELTTRTIEIPFTCDAFDVIPLFCVGLRHGAGAPPQLIDIPFKAAGDGKLVVTVRVEADQPEEQPWTTAAPAPARAHAKVSRALLEAERLAEQRIDMRAMPAEASHFMLEALDIVDSLRARGPREQTPIGHVIDLSSIVAKLANSVAVLQLGSQGARK